MYTKGMGSGHLSRVNATYKGFVKAGIDVRFCACVYRSKYKHLLNPNIEVFEKDVFPDNIDVFICDWRSDEYTDNLPTSLAKLWIGLRRLGTIPSDFPLHYHIIAIEPTVKGDALFYPIINTYPDEIKDRQFLLEYLGLQADNQPIAILGENGAYPKHIETIFEHDLGIDNLLVFKSSNNEIAAKQRNINYYPLAELFKAVDYLVIGGGYNSVHEAMCYANLEKTKIIFVGGDDQKQRIKKVNKWQRKQEPENHKMANYIIQKLNA